MSDSNFVVFGETRNNTTDSHYTYANVLSIGIMEILGDDERFLDCTQADVLNLALNIFHLLISPKKRDEASNIMLHDFVESRELFKEYVLYVMEHCRHHNKQYNLTIDDTLRKEAIQ